MPSQHLDQAPVASVSSLAAMTSSLDVIFL
jgi:hypothetical protein